MPPKSQVENSPNYEEIHEMLLKNISCRDISDYLEKEYGEKISYRAICRYKQKHIKMEEKVNQRVNEKLAAETEKTIQKESEIKVANSKKTDYVVDVNAENMVGVMKIAGELVSEFEKAKSEADDPESKTSHKDITRIALDANKIVNDFNKSQENNIEVNIENNMDGLNKLFNTDKIKRRLNDKRNRNTQ